MAASVDYSRPVLKADQPEVTSDPDGKEPEPDAPSGSSRLSEPDISVSPSSSSTSRPDEEGARPTEYSETSPSSRSGHGLKHQAKSTRTRARRSTAKKSPTRKVNSNSKHASKKTERKPLGNDTAIRKLNSSVTELYDNEESGDNSHEEVETPGDDSVSAFLYNDDFEDDPAAILAAQMGQNTFGYMGALPVQNGQVSPERSKVIQEILRNFDLERVMSRYRGSTMYKSYSHR